MSMQKTFEQEFHALLNECEHIHWKNLDLELLIQYAHMEKRFGKIESMTLLSII